ncbi:MAG: pyridoxal phosphate-dependent aminotransferase [Gemmatimonadetes bacterium]|jgi:aspartate/methionine/tyrosine aminotransferase|nr:pyridoxal phosphate-dependent aminotransferase [Gemmatimonadota bacterium]MBT6147145.1 pyridoxal phosphate-dependent aminotransferase [Gemmatimonadota bacterium]MBT7863879.1 pyridoxal phosphate-dependent aminotransferase [Gemmatimonadota bacterium]
MEAVQAPVIPDVAALLRECPDAISLGQGVVHYPPPPQVFSAVRDFGSNAADHHYRDAAGIPELREGLRAKLTRDNGITLDDGAQSIFVTAGSNMAFYHIVLCLCDPGDEVVVMSPFYFNHEMAIVMANARPVMARTDDAFGLQPEAVEAVLTPRTRAIVTISPNNPSGAVYDADALRQINDLCQQRGIVHISDEAYEYFTYDEAEHLSPGSLPESAQHTVSLFSFSKSHALANWRVGYMVVPNWLLRGLQKSQDTILICPPVISQVAALGALSAGREYCQPFIDELARVRSMALEHLAILGERCKVPTADGAFYLLARLDSPLTPMQLVERLVREHGVAAIPGSGFGLDACHLRIAYGALDADSVEEGMNRLVRGLQSILG